jgi:hypothetical protein
VTKVVGAPSASKARGGHAGAKAGGKKHHRHHHDWEEEGRYGYYTRAWNGSRYTGVYQPYYYREPYSYSGRDYNGRPVFELRFR